MFASEFYKQINACTIGVRLSVIFSDLYVTKTETEVINPFKPKFYKRFVDDIINRKRKDQPDQIFEKLNNNHVNVNYTIEVCPEKFLETKVIYEKNFITNKVYCNRRKLLVRWS